MQMDELRRCAAEQSAPFQAQRNATETELRSLFPEVPGMDEKEISIDDGLRQLGSDSLKVVNLQGYQSVNLAGHSAFSSSASQERASETWFHRF